MNHFPESQSDLIDSWLNNELAGAALQSFLEKRRTDTEFDELVKQHELAHQVLEAGVGRHLKEQMQALNPLGVSSDPIPTAGQGKIRSFWSRPSILTIAAVLVLLLGFGLRWMLTDGNQSLVDRFADSYAAPPVRGIEGPDVLVNQALAAYQETEYAKAKELFASIPADHPRYIEMRFYLANSALIEGDAAAAIENYQLVLEREDIRYSPASEWYLILALLENDQVDLAKLQAQQLADDESHAYSKKATEILKEIEDAD
ncbi:MAG: hypothetical protein AAF587_06035 [Bacteroidota bacterium]